MADRIFRKVAMERQSSPEQLDALMQVTSPKGWLALLAMGGLLLCAVLWGFLGYISVRVTGQGMLMRAGGIREIVSSVSGEIAEIYFQPGEVVEKGRALARINPPELLDCIREAGLSLEELRADRNRMAAGKASAQERRTLEDRVRQAERALRALQEDREASSAVLSPIDGRILELTIGIGDFADRGASLMKMESAGPESGGMQALLYFPAGSGEKIRRGMEAQIAPLVVERSEYGFLKGFVARVADFPSSRQGMMRMLQNETLVETLSREGAPIEIAVDLLPDASAPSGYAWSSSKGPVIALQTGAVCVATVILAKQRPVNLVIPFLKKRLLGIG